MPRDARAPAAARPGFRPSVARVRTLPALIVLFALAGGLRLTLGIDGAMAQDTSAPTLPAASAPLTPAQQVGTDPTLALEDPPAPAAGDQAPSPVSMPSTREEATDAAAMLLELRAREAALDARAEQLDERLAVLEAAEARLQRQITALRAAEAELDATMTRADRIAAEDLAQLVAVFEAMRPEQAAGVFAEMEPNFAAGFLGQLHPATAAGILAGLEPARAYALSATLAGRNASVPRRAVEE